MSLGVAIQSAVFYVIACTPCTGARARSKAKARARRERQEKDRLEAENPGLYRHPSPFNTSPHWDEEIAMGPSLPKKSGSGRHTSSQRRLTSASSGKDTTRSDSTIAISPSISIAAPAKLSKSATMPASAPSEHSPPNPGSSSTVVPDGNPSLSRTVSENWNLKRYQREDEELWGYDIPTNNAADTARPGQKIMDAIAKAGSSAGRLLDSTLLLAGSGSGKDRNSNGELREITNEDRRNFYSPSTPTTTTFSSYRNPPVNDYHPPVVSSSPAHKDEMSWLRQPPPAVKIMEAKVPVSRSASLASTVSRRSHFPGSSANNLSESGLGRVVGERLVGAKLRNGEQFPTGRTPSSGSGARAGGRPRRTTVSSSRSKQSQMSFSPDSSSDDESSEIEAPRTSRRQLAKPSTTPAEAVDDAQDGHASQRPKLETIVSSDLSNSSRQTDLVLSPMESIVGVDPKKAETKLATETKEMAERPSGRSIDSGMALSV
ncbi:hypothetical protein ACKVWC_003747 [Pyricularia oryzae]